MDDAKRFHRSKQAASYAGMVPSVRASGDSVHLGRVTKQGRSALRSLLVQAGQVAFRAKKLTPGLRTWAMRLLFRRGRKIAAIALGRRLFELAHKS